MLETLAAPALDGSSAARAPETLAVEESKPPAAQTLDSPAARTSAAPGPQEPSAPVIEASGKPAAETTWLLAQHRGHAPGRSARWRISKRR